MRPLSVGSFTTHSLQKFQEIFYDPHVKPGALGLQLELSKKTQMGEKKMNIGKS